MIRFAKDDDHKQLKRLWNQVFGDSDAAVDFYFSHRHQNQNMLVYEADSIIAGMMTMLPVQLAFSQKIRPGRYVYAVATAPAYRGQGISTELLLYCHDWMKKNGETASILVPASDSLFAFYKKRGYETLFYVDITTVHSAQLPPFPIGSVCTPCSAQDFYRLRDSAFSGSSLFVKWDKAALEYIIQSATAFGDGVFYVRTKTGDGYAVCGWRGQKVFIREIATANMDMHDVLSILHHTLCADEYMVRLPAGSLPDKEPRSFGMIHYLEDAPLLKGSPPYLSLVLD